VPGEKQVVIHDIHVPKDRTERLDRLLADSIAGLSRRRAQQLLAAGLIRVDGRRARKGEMIVGERTIEVELPGAAPAEIPPESEAALTVLYEDTTCVAVDKPAGRPSHALRAGERGTVANFLAARFPECTRAGTTPLEGGLVHRLDTATSGVLLAARSREAWLDLRRQFRERRVVKLYAAVVHGSILEAGEIRRPIEPHPRSRRKVRVLETGEHSARARPAVTRYTPRTRGAGVTLLEVEISTGVMHQIRAHLAAIGHPVVGDRIYGSELRTGDRHLLHARRLSFDHPVTSARIVVESPLAADFVAAVRRLGLGS
jgi:23S rRNA pseudouridine1911/1915/1917 synthase